MSAKAKEILNWIDLAIREAAKIDGISLKAIGLASHEYEPVVAHLGGDEYRGKMIYRDDSAGSGKPDWA